MAHGEIYTAELGWNTNLEALVARVAADYANRRDPPEGAWIAEMNGLRVGCVLCVSGGEATAQLRTLLVDPAARGHHVGVRLVDECLAFARQAGYASEARDHSCPRLRQ
jgi:N-acetylglutamate synthase-like GNAT family acetyltransferase